MAEQLDTYGDLKKVINTIIGKQKRSALVGTGKEEILGAAIDALGSVFPGVSAAKTAVNFFKAAYSAPDTQKSKTWVDKINVDDEISKIVDDTIENKYLQDLIKNIESKPDEESLPNDFNTTKDLMNYIAGKHQNRTIKAPGIEENKTILKYLLEVENEDPNTFEENPMEFILDKYVSLNEIMTELMTKDYREYLDAVFIVSPKPTSFKIILHNGQYFYMTYMGPAYEASVSGKNYYLSNIGEKERCMIAISKLLRGGSPLKTKGPEGAEQEASAEEGGGSSFSASGGAEETGGEEEAPQLTESNNLKKAILIELLKEAENYSPTKTDPEFFNSVARGLVKLGATVKREVQNRQPEIRTNIGSKEEAENKIIKALAKEKINKDDYKITYVPAKQFDKGAKSGSYATYIIVAKKSIGKDIKRGDAVYVISTVKEGIGGGVKSTITQKALTPRGLGLEGTYNSVDSLAEEIEKSINSKFRNLTPLVSSLIKDVRGNTNQDEELSEITTVEKTIPYSEETVKLMNKVSPADIAILGKDFGELLGGVFLGELVGVEDSIVYPQAANEPLIDFFIDGYKISSKYDKGASASITELIRGIDPNQIKKKSEEDSFYNTMKLFTIKELSSPDAFIRVAEKEKKNMPAISILAKIIGVDIKSLNKQVINDYIVKLINSVGGEKASSEKKNAALLRKFTPFYEAIGRYPQDKKVEWNRLTPEKYYGTVTSPLSYYVKDKLNEIQTYTKQLKTLVGKTEIKQMYLIFASKKGSMSFKIKSFNDPGANFEFEIPSISVYNPTASKLGFKLK